MCQVASTYCNRRRRDQSALQSRAAAYMGITPEGAERSRGKVVAALDRIEAELRPSGYLVGDRFSVADLAAAALLSPLVWPAEYAYPMPAIPERVARWRDSLGSRRAFQWAADMYRRHRVASAVHSNPVATLGSNLHLHGGCARERSRGPLGVRAFDLHDLLTHRRPERRRRVGRHDAATLEHEHVVARFGLRQIVR